MNVTRTSTDLSKCLHAVFIHQEKMKKSDYLHLKKHHSTFNPSYEVILSQMLSLTQVILGLRGAKLGSCRKNLTKILTFGQLTLQLTLWHNFTLLLHNVFRIKHPFFVRGINFMLIVIIHEKYIYPMLQKTNISLTVQTTQSEVIEFSPFIRRQFILELVWNWLFSKTTKVVFLERGPCSAVRNVSRQGLKSSKCQDSKISFVSHHVFWVQPNAHIL